MLFKGARVRETLNLLTCADSITATKVDHENRKNCEKSEGKKFELVKTMTNGENSEKIKTQ